MRTYTADEVDAMIGRALARERERVAQPQQEPEWYHFVRHGEDCFVPYSGQAPEKATPLYTKDQL